jgi:hypothetical protein
MPISYDNSSVYNKYASDCESCGSSDSSSCGCNTSSSDCGCCPVGTVAIYDDCGKHLGCLTPTDADKFVNAKLEVPEGYVKVFHPTTGDYLGALPPAQAIELLNFLNGDGVVTVPVATFNVVAPVPSVLTGMVELTADESDPNTRDVVITIDRVNMDEIIVASISGTAEDITFYPSGTTTPISSELSEITVSFAWGNTVTAGDHFFNVTLTSSTVVRTIPFSLTLT